jgi:hypothetical protein
LPCISNTLCETLPGAIEQFGSHFITEADWGCEDGVHCCWMIVQADSRDEAMRMVPAELRQQVRIIKLNRFTRETLAARIAELED